MFERIQPYAENEIDRPTLVLNSARALRNIATMKAKAARADARLRPHFKTHNSHQVGQLFRASGIEAITVSSIEMAEYFSLDGWSDITIGFPLNVRGLERVRTLADHCRLGVTVDAVDAITALRDAGIESVRVWIEVDTGYRRTGIPASDVEAIVGLAKSVTESPGLAFAGLLSHAGQSYAATSRGEIAEIWDDALRAMRGAMAALVAAGVPEGEISVGDTPGCSVVDDLRGPAELRPGNFVFYDAQQLRLGACSPDDLALVVACPVVASYPDRQEVVIQGGAAHFSKDSATRGDGTRAFGLVMDVGSDWTLLEETEASVTKLSQEHGVIRMKRDRCAQTPIGSLLHIVPAHACLTANALGPALVAV